MNLKNIPLLSTSTLIAFTLVLTSCGERNKSSADAGSRDAVIPVTLENFIHAESSMYFQKQQDKYPVNQWQHVRQMADKDHQDIIRMNADTAYSIAIVDVSEGATISLPDSEFYQSILVIDENHYNPHVIYSGESVHLTLADVTAGEHVYLLMRTSEEDMERRQDEAVIDAKSAKPFVSKNYDQEQLDKLRAELITRMAEVQPRAYLAFGTKEEVDPEVHLVASAAGWAGLPAKHAMYIPDLPVQDRSGVPSSITFEPPMLHYEKGAFWSITAYNGEGWIATDNFAINSKRAKPNADGSYTIRFNCEGEENNVTVPEGWNATFRTYMPVDVQQNLGFVKGMLQNHMVVPVETGAAKEPAQETVKVTAETYIRAESDRQFGIISQMAGGVNRFFHFRSPTPLDKQNVVRMNRDTLYSMAVVDTSNGATITVPELPGDRYVSVFLTDNDRYCPFVIYTAGRHELPRDTQYLGVGIRIQVINPHDKEEIALVNELQDRFIINAGSANPIPPLTWDMASLQALTEAYEKDSAEYSSWKGMMGPRGKVDERTRHIAAAAG